MRAAMRALAPAVVALSACFPAAARAVAVQCDIDGLWHQPQAASAGSPLVTAAIKSATGAGTDFRVEQALPSFSSRAGGSTDVPEGYYATPHAAIGCAPAGCLTSPAHGCRQIHSGSSAQCVWEGGEDAAASACSAWEQCDGFWCGPAADVPGSNASWCWARGATDVMNAKVFQGATAFIKTDLPHLIELKCTSDGCPWIWATGAWDRQTNKLSVAFDNGNKTTAVMHGNCSEIEWAGGAVWRNEMQLIERVHVVYMAHFDVGYTSPNVEALLDVYATQYFPQVFNVSESIRSKYPDRADLQ